MTRYRSPGALAFALLAALGACGGKVGDDRDAGPLVTSPAPVPVDPGPSPPEPGPSPLPPPPVPDAGVTPTDTLVGGSPQCSKHLPTGDLSCRTTTFGYTPKCEYQITSSDGGTCRWFCFCSETSPGSMSYQWLCDPVDCP